MSWSRFLAQVSQEAELTITILADNAPGHSLPLEEEDESEHDFDDCPSFVSAHSSCCAELRECELESDEDSVESHEHTKPACRWDSCPHSKCCPKLPCRIREEEEEVEPQAQKREEEVHSHDHEHDNEQSRRRQVHKDKHAQALLKLGVTPNHSSSFPPRTRYHHSATSLKQVFSSSA